MQTFETTITRMTRITNTVNGGPRYQVDVDLDPGLPVRYVTADDTQDSFAWSPDALIGKPVTVTLNERHRIIGIDLAPAVVITN